MVTRFRFGALVLAAMLGALGMVASPAYAAGRVGAHDSMVTIGADGALQVRTTITLGGAAPATLVQRVRLREDAMNQSEYVYAVSDPTITVDGRPGEVKKSKDELTFSAPTAGAKEVVISYRVAGAAHATPGGTTSVRWNVLQGLDAQADAVSATVGLPAPFRDFQCVAGPPATQQSCALAEGAPHAGQPRISDGPRGEREIVGLRTAFAASDVAANEKIDEKWTVGRAFSAAPLPLGVALGLLALGGVLLWLLHRRAGRDADPDGAAREIARFERRDGVSVFKVGDSVLPGQIGTVVDERVDPIDVTATILDLAVRGHVLIEELPRRSEFAPADWTFRRMPGERGDAPLRPFEVELLDAIAPEDGRQVRVSEIGPTISAHVPSIQNHLYDEMVEHGWYERRPDSTRNVWNQGALVALILAVAITGVLAAFTAFGLAGVALIALALGLAFVAQEMPARTPSGAQLLAGLGTLRQELLTHPTDEMPAGQEYRELSQVLPYAVVLGGVDRWLTALVAADDDDDVADPTDLYWFHGPDTWHLRDLPDSLKNFITTVSGNLFAR